MLGRVRNVVAFFHRGAIATAVLTEKQNMLEIASQTYNGCGNPMEQVHGYAGTLQATSGNVILWIATTSLMQKK